MKCPLWTFTAVLATSLSSSILFTSQWFLCTAVVAATATTDAAATSRPGARWRAIAAGYSPLNRAPLFRNRRQKDGDTPSARLYPGTSLFAVDAPDLSTALDSALRNSWELETATLTSRTITGRSEMLESDSEALDDSDFYDDDDILFAGGLSQDDGGKLKRKSGARRFRIWPSLFSVKGNDSQLKSKHSASAKSISRSTIARGGSGHYASQREMYNANSFRRSLPRPPYRLWNPQSDAHPGETTLTGKLFTANIILFGLQTMYPILTQMGAKRSDLLLEGRQLYRLLTPVFLHGGVAHLMSNSYSLRAVGPNVERTFGPARFLTTYLVSGIAGNVLSAIKSPNPAVGASGAIFGLVGAYYTFLSRNKEFLGYGGEMQRSTLVETIGINVVLGMTNPMIDNWGHLGGFLGGAAMAYYFGPKLYMARLPNGTRVVVDRPTIPLSTPPVFERTARRLEEGIENLGSRVRSIVAFGGSEPEFVTDVDVGEGWKPKLDGDIYVTPNDGLRRDVPKSRALSRSRRQTRRKSMPRNKSIRPRYSRSHR